MSGIYLHIPFCDTKCIYCDFYSITNHTKKAEFINALLKEIEHYPPLLKDHHFDSIFFGGGTPSLLDIEDFERIFDSIYRNYHISDHSEVTIEANPGTLNKQKLIELKKLPINRISFGVQSFKDSDLKFLTRIHTADEAINSIKNAQDAGYDNINLDLISALPNQQLDVWKYNLRKAVSLQTQHVSAYSLIFEEGTPLYEMRRSGRVNEADIELEAEMFDFTSEFLSNNGFGHYEISNFAKPGFECRHNLKYWNREEYIAFGPSASSFVGNKRWTNVKNLNRYIESIESDASDKSVMSVVDFEELIDIDTAIREQIFLGLRSRGVDMERYSAVFKHDFKARHLTSINMLVRSGHAKVENNVFSLTRKGYAMCDEIVTWF